MLNQCILFSICVGTSTTTRNWELGFLKRNVDQGFFHHLPNVWHTMSHPLVNAVSESADSGYAVIWGCPKWFSVCVLTWFWLRFQNFLGIFVKIYNKLFFYQCPKAKLFLHIPDVFKKRFNMEFESFDQRLGLTLKKHFMGIFVNKRFPVIVCKQLCRLHRFLPLPDTFAAELLLIVTLTFKNRRNLAVLVTICMYHSTTLRLLGNFRGKPGYPEENEIIILTKYVTKVSEPPGKFQVLSSVLDQTMKILQQFHSWTLQVCPKKSLTISKRKKTI